MSRGRGNVQTWCRKQVKREDISTHKNITEGGRGSTGKIYMSTNQLWSTPKKGEHIFCNFNKKYLQSPSCNIRYFTMTTLTSCYHDSTHHVMLPWQHTPCLMSCYHGSTWRIWCHVTMAAWCMYDVILLWQQISCLMSYYYGSTHHIWCHVTMVAHTCDAMAAYTLISW